MQKVIFKSLVVVMMMALIGCSGSISDATIKTQVTDYLKSLRVMGFMTELPYDRIFEVSNIVVKDKLIKEKENAYVVICAVTSKCKMDIETRSIGHVAFEWLIGDTGGKAGELKTHDVKFLFEKYENGWKLKGRINQPIKP